MSSSEPRLRRRPSRPLAFLAAAGVGCGLWAVATVALFAAAR